MSVRECVCVCVFTYVFVASKMFEGYITKPRDTH